MTILVTGGAGFIGSRLAHRLYLEGHKVVIVDNMSYGYEDNFIFEDVDLRDVLNIYEMDVSDENRIESLFDEYHFDYVYHFAGISALPECQLNKKKCMMSNVVGTEVILECARKYGVKRVMFSSSNSVYELYERESFPFKEDYDIETRLLYPTSKHLSEDICKSFNRTYHLPVTIFRFSNVYGPGMDITRKYPPVTGAFIKNLYHNEEGVVYGSGEQSRDFIYVEDLLDLIELPMSKATHEFEIMNVTSGEPHSILEQYHLITLIIDKRIPARFVEPENFWKKMPEIYEGEYKISEETLVKEVGKCTQSSNEYAKKEYGWSPKYSFRQGLERTVNDMLKILERTKQ